MRDHRASLTRRAALRALTAAGAVGAFPALLGFAPGPVQPFGGLALDSVERSGGLASGSVERSEGFAPGPAARSELGPLPARPGTMIMVIRHGEKPADGSAAGIDLNGRPDGHSLTERGWTRAVYLVDLFDPDHGPTRTGLARPSVIYASGTGKGDREGTRPRQTVGPLAAELGVPVDTTFARGQEVALVTQAAARPGPTLICWQHGEIPAIAAAFGPVTPAPPRAWPDDRFDIVWTFTATQAGWRFAQVPEMLLPGDADTGFA